MSMTMDRQSVEVRFNRFLFLEQLRQANSNGTKIVLVFLPNLYQSIVLTFLSYSPSQSIVHALQI
jgi:hypothetical protein